MICNCNTHAHEVGLRFHLGVAGSHIHFFYKGDGVYVILWNIGCGVFVELLKGECENERGTEKETVSVC